MENREYSSYQYARNVASEIVDKLQKDSSSTPTLDDFIVSNICSEKIINLLSDRDNIDKKLLDYENIDAQGALNSLMATISIRKKRRRFKSLIIASASIASALIVLSFLILTNRDNTYYESSNTIVEQNVKYPQLTLSDGSNINLSQSAKVDENSIEIVKDGNSAISYKKNRLTYSDSINKTVDTHKKEIKYNTIVVPSGFTYNVKMSDGTKVRINANSELKYPVEFTSSERRVYLIGEAYFDVAKGETPFLVEASNLNIEAYGTAFNINTNVKNHVSTILVSGSVGVYPKDHKEKEIIMQPNQLTTYDKVKNDMVVTPITPYYYLGWLDNQFICNENKLSALLDDMSSWYGVKFKCKLDTIYEIPITVTFNRNSNINSILSSLERVLDIKFVMEGHNKYVIE